MATVGGEVDSVCGKCKMTLAHTILAMVGPKIARVRCNTCGSDHSYRTEAGSTRGSATTTSRARAPSAAAKEKAHKLVISFDEELATKDLSRAKEYSTRTAFETGDVMSHPTFGMGIVAAVRGDKVDVNFKMTQKTLMHARGEAPAARPAFAAALPQSSGPADKPQAEPAETES
jgi:hypothetical protein